MIKPELNRIIYTLTIYKNYIHNFQNILRLIKKIFYKTKMKEIKNLFNQITKIRFKKIKLHKNLNKIFKIKIKINKFKKNYNKYRI